ncbi:EamA family transporter [Nocardia xishanensis]
MLVTEPIVANGIRFRARSPNDPRWGKRLRGPLPILTAAVLWGSTGTASSLAPGGAPAAAVGAAGLALGGLLLVLSGLGVRPCFSGTEWRSLTVGAVAVHLAFFTTFLAYRLFGYGLRHTPVEVAATLTLAEPAVAALLGVVIVGERLPLVSWCGLAVLGAGLALLTLAPARPSRAA